MRESKTAIESLFAKDDQVQSFELVETVFNGASAMQVVGAAILVLSAIVSFWVLEPQKAKSKLQNISMQEHLAILDFYKR